jgi:hypothetical protein
LSIEIFLLLSSAAKTTDKSDESWIALKFAFICLLDSMKGDIRPQIASVVIAMDLKGAFP